ncbi:unnamed protein product [Symbiodinium natans]|uniref:Uncharacterized protein n=1 Tax=Symbiodinium natans TaxID=878477 RepID=A0A812PCT3_9DINO|nr:unnamed protein product [Symbiodinium natans]
MQVASLPGPIILIGQLPAYGFSFEKEEVYKYGSHEALDDDDQDSLGVSSENASQRLQRTRFALKTMGSATTGSAITTAGLLFFMVDALPCANFPRQPRTHMQLRL